MRSMDAVHARPHSGHGGGQHLDRQRFSKHGQVGQVTQLVQQLRARFSGYGKDAWRIGPLHQFPHDFRTAAAGQTKIDDNPVIVCRLRSCKEGFTVPIGHRVMIEISERNRQSIGHGLIIFDYVNDHACVSRNCDGMPRHCQEYGKHSESDVRKNTV